MTPFTAATRYATLSSQEAARIIGVDTGFLERLLNLSQISTCWEEYGRVGEDTVRLLWKKLHS